ncbi:hypothetical protein M885DRAFT_534134 [Pelagophyceae sp. CCMP2097]|nr:hypothetical protein M885DRAFT_534134 [Pelagophyceae sp. CCMP2097]
MDPRHDLRSRCLRLRLDVLTAALPLQVEGYIVEALDGGGQGGGAVSGAERASMPLCGAALCAGAFGPPGALEPPVLADGAWSVFADEALPGSGEAPSQSAEDLGDEASLRSSIAGLLADRAALRGAVVARGFCAAAWRSAQSPPSSALSATGPCRSSPAVRALLCDVPCARKRASTYGATERASLKRTRSAKPLSKAAVGHPREAEKLGRLLRRAAELDVSRCCNDVRTLVAARAACEEVGLFAGSARGGLEIRRVDSPDFGDVAAASSSYDARVLSVCDFCHLVFPGRVRARELQADVASTTDLRGAQSRLEALALALCNVALECVEHALGRGALRLLPVRDATWPALARSCAAPTLEIERGKSPKIHVQKIHVQKIHVQKSMSKKSSLKKMLGTISRPTPWKKVPLRTSGPFWRLRRVLFNGISGTRSRMQNLR